MVATSVPVVTSDQGTRTIIIIIIIIIIVCLLRIFKMFHGLMNNPVYHRNKIIINLLIA